MAIGFDAGSSVSDTNGTGVSWSHTCAGSNRLLVVSISNNLTVAYSGANTMTYNSVPMTFLASQQDVAMWYLINPSTGSNTINFDCGINHRKSGAAASYTGVLQSGQPDSNTTGTASSSASLTLTTTVVTDNSWVIGAFSNTQFTQSAGTNTTERSEGSGAGNTAYTAIADSNAIRSPGSQSIQQTSAGADWKGVVMSVKPFVTNNTLAMGQGSYSLAGQAIIFIKGYSLVAVQGAYTLAGQIVTLLYTQKWVNQTKNSTVFTNETKQP